MSHPTKESLKTVISSLQQDKQQLTNHTVALSESLANMFDQLQSLNADVFGLKNQVKRERIRTICVANDLAQLTLPDFVEMWKMSDENLNKIYNDVLDAYTKKIKQ